MIPSNLPPSRLGGTVVVDRVRAECRFITVRAKAPQPTAKAALTPIKMK
jgi:hypothetical protein